MPTAVLVPQTALLVPGAAGRADVLPTVRAAALEVTRELVATGPGSVLVVAPAPRDREVDAATVCARLTGLGIPERHLGWRAPCRGPGCPDHETAPDPTRVVGTAAAVGLRLLAAAGWDGPTTVREVGSVERRADASDALRGDVAGPGSGLDPSGGAGADGVVVVGSLSARHGEAAPRAADPRAPKVDAAFAAALEDPTPDRLAWLARADDALAAELDVGGAGPWRVLAGLAAGQLDRTGGSRSQPGPVDAARRVSARLVARDRSLGVDHRVWHWRWAP